MSFDSQRMIYFIKMNGLYKWLHMRSAYLLESTIFYKIAASNRVHDQIWWGVKTKLMYLYLAIGLWCIHNEIFLASNNLRINYVPSEKSLFDSIVKLQFLVGACQWSIISWPVRNNFEKIPRLVICIQRSHKQKQIGKSLLWEN